MRRILILVDSIIKLKTQKNYILNAFFFLIFSFAFIILQKNMNFNFNENLALTFLASTNVKLIKDINYNKIIKRFSQVGQKKIGEKMAKTSVSNPNIPHTKTVQNPNKGLPKYSSQKNNETTTTSTKSTTSNKPKFKEFSKQTKEEEKNPLKDFLKNENDPLKENTKNKIPLKEKVIESLFTPLDLQGNIENIPEKKIEDKKPSEPIIIAIDIKSQTQPQTPEQKHTCLGERQNDGSVIVTAFYTSSAGHSQEKYNFGQPQNTKVSSTKVDKSYIPEKQKVQGIDDQGNKKEYKIEIRVPAKDNEDGAGCSVPSPTKGGQYVRKLHHPLKIEKNNYTENEEATKYTQNADVYKQVVGIHKKVVNTKQNLVEQQDYIDKQQEDYDE